MKLIKVLEFVDADAEELKKFSDDVRKEKFDVYAVGSKLLFAFGNSESASRKFVNHVEEHAFDLGLDDTKIKLFVFDPETGNLTDIQSVLEGFADENESEELDDGVPMSQIQELLDFVFENEDEIGLPSEETIVNETPEPKSQVVVSDSKKILPEDAEPDTESDEGFVDDIDDSVSALTPKEEVLSGISSVATSERKESYQTREDNREVAQTMDEEQVQNERTELASHPLSNEYLLEQAIALFDRQNHNELARFDEVTNRQVQSEILNAQFIVANARGKGIEAVYNRLKAGADKSKKLIEEKIIPVGKKEHDSTLAVLDRNLSTDIKKLVEREQKSYQENRENFVQAQLPILRLNYDAENLENHQKNLATAIEGLKQETHDKVQLENEGFNNYLETVFKNSDEKVVSEVSIEDILNDYNEVIEGQKEALKSYVEGIKRKVEEELNLVTSERDGLKNKVENLESERKLDAEKLRSQQALESNKLKEVTTKSDEKLNEMQSQIEKLSRDNEVLVQENHSLKLQSIPRMALVPEQNTDVQGQSKDKKNFYQRLCYWWNLCGGLTSIWVCWIHCS